MLRRLNLWLHQRLRNFLLYSAVVFGLPFYLLICAVRAGGIELWVRILDVFLGFGAGLVWGLAMWLVVVRHKAEAIRKTRRGE